MKPYFSFKKFLIVMIEMNRSHIQLQLEILCVLNYSLFYNGNIS
jgi:hypothetical protein